MEIVPIAHIHSAFPTKFGIPRQSGLAPSLRSTVVFTEPYAVAESVRGLEEFSHLWLIWGFSETMRETWSPTVRPPRLGGNQRMGVFATRSTFRPNALGLSSVKLERVEIDAHGRPVLHVLGADLMDGTPIYDIKPYLTTTDCHPDAIDGFVATHRHVAVQVVIPDEIAKKIPADLLPGLREVLAQDPRPAYHHDPERVYGFPFGAFDIQFKVNEETLTVVGIAPLR